MPVKFILTWEHILIWCLVVFIYPLSCRLSPSSNLRMYPWKLTFEFYCLALMVRGTMLLCSFLKFWFWTIPLKAHMLKAWFSAHGATRRDETFKRWGLGRGLRSSAMTWMAYQSSSPIGSLSCWPWGGQLGPSHANVLPCQKQWGQLTRHWNLWNCEPENCFFFQFALLQVFVTVKESWLTQLTMLMWISVPQVEREHNSFWKFLSQFPNCCQYRLYMTPSFSLEHL